MIHMKDRPFEKLYLHVNLKVVENVKLYLHIQQVNILYLGKKPSVNKFLSFSSYCWINISALFTMYERASS